VTVHSVPVLGGAGVSPEVPVLGAGVTLGAPPLPVLDLSGDPTIGTGSVTIALTNGPLSAPFVAAIDLVTGYYAFPGPFVGPFLLGPPPPPPFLFGVLSASGTFSLPISLAGLPPTLAHVPFHLQAVAFDVSRGAWRLSNGETVILRP
jgi:hypothetical protein